MNRREGYQFQVLKPNIHGSSKYTLPALKFISEKPKVRLNMNTRKSFAKLHISSLSRPTPHRMGSSMIRTTEFEVELAPVTRIHLEIAPVPAKLPIQKRKVDARFSNSLKSVEPKPLKLEEDNFYFKNISKQNFTLFQDLLQVVNESVSPYSYMARANKSLPLSFKRRRLPQPNKNSDSQSISKRQGFVRNYTSIDCLTITKPQKTMYRDSFHNKIILFCVERVLLCKDFSDPSALWTRPKLIKAFHKLQNVYQIVLVANKHCLALSKLLHVFRSQEIFVSGVYESNDDILDYSEIFRDFKIKSPRNDAIIVGAVNLVDEEIEDRKGAELISYVQGTSMNLLVDKAPLSMTEIPIMLLLPPLSIGNHSVSAVSIVNLLLSAKNTDFVSVLMNSKLKVVSCSDVAQVLLERNAQVTIENVRENDSIHCKTHSLPTEEPDSLPLNQFAVMKLSMFPSTLVPNPL